MELNHLNFKLFYAMICCIFLNSLIIAQSNEKIPIKVSHEQDDEYGKRLVYNIREGIKKSQQYRLSYSEAGWKVIIITDDPLWRVFHDYETKGLICSYSVVITFRPSDNSAYWFVDHFASTFPTKLVESASQQIVVKIDKSISSTLEKIYEELERRMK